MFASSFERGECKQKYNLCYGIDNAISARRRCPIDRSMHCPCVAQRGQCLLTRNCCVNSHSFRKHHGDGVDKIDSELLKVEN